MRLRRSPERGKMEKNSETDVVATTATQDKNCPKCGTKLVGGIKYQDVCTTCEPFYLTRCGSCWRPYWDCICVRPSTWE